MTQLVFSFADRWPERCQGVDPEVLFDTPDRLLTLLRSPPQQMLQGYRQVLDQPVSPRPFWQLEHGQRPGIEPLSGALMRVMLGECSELLDAYQELDRRSGGDGDPNYLERLQLALRPEALLQAFRLVGELRAELDDQVQLVQQLKDQLDSYRELQQRSQRLWDQMVQSTPED